MIPLLQFIDVVIIDLIKWVVIISIVVSWLVAFGIINTYNDFSRTVIQFLETVTEPMLAPFRRLVPPINGIDLAPLLLILFLLFLQLVVIRGWLIPLFASGGGIRGI